MLEVDKGDKTMNQFLAKVAQVLFQFREIGITTADDNQEYIVELLAYATGDVENPPNPDNYNLG